MARYCGKCGGEIWFGDNFCSICGSLEPETRVRPDYDGRDNERLFQEAVLIGERRKLRKLFGIWILIVIATMATLFIYYIA